MCGATSGSAARESGRALTLIGGTVAREMADYFLKVDGIAGESTDAKHKDEIDVLAFSWGVSQTGGASSGGGGGTGKAVFDDLLVVARTSKASPHLWLACAVERTSSPRSSPAVGAARRPSSSSRSRSRTSSFLRMRSTAPTRSRHSTSSRSRTERSRRNTRRPTWQAAATRQHRPGPRKARV